MATVCHVQGEEWVLQCSGDEVCCWVTACHAICTQSPAVAPCHGTPLGTSNGCCGVVQVRAQAVVLPEGGVFVVAHCLAPSLKAETAASR